MSLKEKCSGVQSEVWTGEGESLCLCQVKCQVKCVEDKGENIWQVRERQVGLGSSLVSTPPAL